MWLSSFNPGTLRSEPRPGRSRLQQLGQRVKGTLFSSAVMRCEICHAELTPDEFNDRSCGDRTACCLRRFSQRCL